MTFKELAYLAGKKRRTVETFFSRKGLSIDRLADVKKYLDYLYSDAQWRKSNYRGAHLKRYQYSKN